MSPLVKHILEALVKPSVDNAIAQLKANRDANIATVEALVVSSGGTASTAIIAFVSGHLSANPFVKTVLALVLPSLASEMAMALGTAGSAIPGAYDAAVAFLEKEDAYL